MGIGHSRNRLSQPLLRIFCLYAAGVLFGYWIGPRASWALFAFLAMTVAGVLFPRNRVGPRCGRPGLRGTGALSGSGSQHAITWLRGIPGTRFPFHALLLVLAGWLNLAAHTRIWSAQDLRQQITGEAVLAEVRGRLVGTPRLTMRQRDGLSVTRTLAELEVAMIRTEGGAWRPATGRVAASSPGELPEDFFDGRAVEVRGVLARPPGRLADGLFDYAAYLERRGIHFQLSTDGSGDWDLAPATGSTPPFTVRFIRWARQTLARGLPPEDPATGLIQAMTLGWNTALTDEIEEPFMKSGTMHVFAISGQHIALVAGIVLSVLRLARIPRGVCGGLLIPMLWFYTAATGWQASAVRATVMMTVVVGGWSLQRPSDLLNSLAASALVILLIEPRQLFQASFQLSFMVVLALALVLPPLQERVLERLEPDPLVPAHLIPRWKRWLGRPMRWLAVTLATSLAAWVGSMPLTAQYFHLFSPGSLLANVLLVPCAGAALASALASLATGAWCPWLSDVFNHGGWFWMHCMLWLSEGVAGLPGAYGYVPAPSTALWMVYLGTFLVIAFGWVKGARLRWLMAGAAVLVPALLYAQEYSQRASSAVTTLPLEGGLAIHLKVPGRWEPILLDCGNTNAFQAVLAPFLRARGENGLQALALTHGDVRHMGAAPLLLDAFPAGTVGISTVRFRSGPYRRLADHILPAHRNLIRLKQGNAFEGWEVLHPPDNLKVSRADTGVMVLRGALRGTTFLFLSDLDRQGQRRLLESVGRERLRTEIMVTGLPAEGEPWIHDLLEAVRPTLIVVGDDRHPANRRASAERISGLRACGARVLSTAEFGAITIRITDRGWEAVNARGEVLERVRRRPGRKGQSEKACRLSASGLRFKCKPHEARTGEAPGVLKRIQVNSFQPLAQ